MDKATLRRAAAEMARCQSILESTGLSLVGEVSRGFGELVPGQHYPPDDSYDPVSHAQYYFHRHAQARRDWSDHGHFHIFLRPLGMPPGIRPAPLSDLIPEGGGNDRISHVVALSMDAEGRPHRLFTTNRWVTAETWYAAQDVVAMLDHVRFDHGWPSWPLNRWLGAFLVLCRDDIVRLLHERDRVLTQWAADHPGTNVFEDRALEVVSWAPVELDAKLARLD